MSDQGLIRWKKDDPHYRQARYREAARELVREVSVLETNPQNVHTPFSLCDQILDRLAQEISLKDCDRIAVLFNLEFVNCLIERGISPRQIWFFADSSLKRERAEEWYNVHVLDIRYDSTKKNGERINIMPKPKKQFDVVIMNPPYQPPTKKNAPGEGSGSRSVLWDKFVVLGLEILQPDGFLAAIHPTKWRKPDDKMFPVITGNRIHYLEMHTKQDGINTFGASTPFDWYVLQKASPNGKVEVRDTSGQSHSLDLSSFSFLPNNYFPLIAKLVGKKDDKKCEVLHSFSAYEHRKAWMHATKTNKFKYPCVHSTPTTGNPRLWFSSKREEFFGVSKVVFGDSDTIANVIIDMDGEYGITDHGIGIAVSSRTNAVRLKKALESPKFNDVLKACRWSQFQIDFRMFREFRADFWKEFV